MNCSSFIITSSLILFSTILSGQGTVIWGGAGDPNGEFNGGLNDWTTIGVSAADPDSANNAVWVWSSNSKADNGSFWGTRGAIQSPSVINGAAVFNSDFLDNNGEAINPDSSLNSQAFGTGPAPAPHTGALISPTFDCSGYSKVHLKFHQYYRNYQSNPVVKVSADNGMTYTDFPVNQQIPTNQETPADDVITLDITQVAAGSDQVRINFTFEGEYYFWIIDDVSVIAPPVNDLSLGTKVHFPVQSLYTPECILTGDTLSFFAHINNHDHTSTSDVNLTAEIIDENSNTLWNSTASLSALPARTFDSLVHLPDVFVFNGSLGDYFIKYTVSSSSSVDEVPANNTVTYPFHVTQNRWQNEEEPAVMPHPLDSLWFHDQVSVAFNFNDQQCISINDIDIGISSRDTSFLSATMEVYLLQVSQDLLDSISLQSLLSDTTLYDNISISAYAYKDIQLSQATMDHTNIRFQENEFVDWFTFDTLSQINIEDGMGLIVQPSFVALNDFFRVNFANTHPNFKNQNYVIHNSDNDLIELPANLFPMVRINSPFILDNRDNFLNIPKPTFSFKLQPVPANNYIELAFSQPQAIPHKVTLTNASGQLLRTRDLYAARDRSHIFNTSDLQPGMYFLSVRNKFGVFSRKLIKQ